MITTDIQLATETLKRGDLVAIPTETVYGLAANALNAAAVAKVYDLKQRPLDHPLIVHVATLESAKALVTSFPEKALHLAKRFWPGPLTLILPKSHLVPDITSGGLESVAIRVPNHPLTLDLISKTGFPLAAPSANPFGSISPTCPEHVESSFGNRAPLILDGGQCKVGVESTIVSFLNSEPCILRLGGLSIEEIETVIGKVEVVGKSEKSIAPGMLPQHYAPRTPLVLLNEGSPLPSVSKKGLITFSGIANRKDFQKVEILSPTGSLEEAACALYGAMRRLDDSHLDIIIAFRFPEHGLGRAINDRLERASQKLADSVK